MQAPGGVLVLRVEPFATRVCPRDECRPVEAGSPNVQMATRHSSTRVAEGSMREGFRDLTFQRRGGSCFYRRGEDNKLQTS